MCVLGPEGVCSEGSVLWVATRQAVPLLSEDGERVLHRQPPCHTQHHYRYTHTHTHSLLIQAIVVELISVHPPNTSSVKITAVSHDYRSYGTPADDDANQLISENSPITLVQYKFISKLAN